ncbi:MAG: sulfite exporter TauE/SafE family protein [Sedimentisphaerales bacterium]|nr:sulfite exporter TauE/SafE family protein [Sedimentisphaerales bacterium]
MTMAFYIMLGLTAGVLSGLLGIGGGIIAVPALVLLCGFSQHLAQGTTLAMLVPPIGLLAAWAYYSKGYVDLKVAGLMCIGFFVGGFLGAKFAGAFSDIILKRIFGVALMLISVKMIFGK